MEENKYYYCHVVGTTDVGCVRKANEDNMGSGETINGLVSVVCDGMGGHVGGATASRLAVDAILDFLNQMYFEDPREAIGKAIDAANMAVLHKVQTQPELRGMGTTCVLLLVRDGQVYYGHVGDSRIYLVRKHIIKQLTKDQSYVQMLVDMGQITPEEAEHHERKNEITNAIGVEGMQYATVCDTPINPEAGDCFLLCSDGLSGMVSNHEIEKIVSNQVRMRAQERTDALVEKAKQYGGLDNITAQIVEFSVTPNQKGNVFDKKKLAMYGGIGLTVIAIVVLLFVFKPWKQNPNGSSHEEEKEQKRHDSIVKARNDSLRRADSIAKTGNLGDFINPKEIEHLTIEVDFKAKEIFSTITFTGESTTVEFGGEKIVIEKECDKKSLSPINGISTSSNDNVITLSFGDKFVDTVEFGLTTTDLLSKEIHRFKVVVKKAPAKTWIKPKTDKAGTNKYDDCYKYDVPKEIEFESRGIACIIQFVNQGNKYSINIFDKNKNRIGDCDGKDGQGFKIDGKGKDIKSVCGCVVKYKKDDHGGKYEVRFGEKRPEKDIITFEAYDSSGNKCLISVKLVHTGNGDADDNGNDFSPQSSGMLTNDK